ncbi:MAG: acyl-CoA desaturase [Bdellovibrionales bacterium CG12_big_fil_rev_8_21_14_0_65_38_15]|nr:MAG: acyl-CoA desaturase [Bdellovibrionales bacterium CG22_combo_CG10-13_8_21_14_all_38_13]PIQ56655.1 MAG: acyl-CoA desaturase [Bdellovibrionales bacterium CG12_big_fil_rev_8_21_14_0_65_38_15]PIR31228.1 MAG: acyl-CoA desaturase [Bdellovibrionales bacterium CG11_big_fil_rev_8_21_14_0_20_38_13]
MEVIIVFFIVHYFSSLFFQSFYLHRFGAHGMYEMTPKTEKVVHLLTFLSQGSSYLNPTAYAIMHKAHHSYSDTELDPHSPHMAKNLTQMMLKTAKEYMAILDGKHEFNSRFSAQCSHWETLEKIGDHWMSRVVFGAIYFFIYLVFAPSWHWFLLLPIHFLMGPIHGAIVNWCGHKYGYRNHNTNDLSKNSLPFDFLAMGELFQNNHHRYPNRSNFATRWFEFDPTFAVMKILKMIGVIDIKNEKKVSIESFEIKSA